MFMVRRSVFPARFFFLGLKSSLSSTICWHHVNVSRCHGFAVYFDAASRVAVTL